jgi:hypothetical protein
MRARGRQWIGCSAVLGLMLAIGPVAAQQGPAPTGAVVDMATVQVTGEQPGPGLWKVTAPLG